MTLAAPPLIIHHGGRCLDGFGAAFAAWLHFVDHADGPGDYLAANHGEDLPPHQGREVYLLDFAYPRPLMAELCAGAGRVTVLDHHASAERDLAGLEREHPNLRLHFDMQRSGAVISWDYFHRRPAPWLLLDIQDRDLWQHRIAGSEHVNAALMAQPLGFELWRELLDTPGARERLVTEGAAINRYRHQEIELHVKRAVSGEIAGHRVPVVNCPLSLRSEVLNILAQGQPFAAGYSDRGGRRSWSLRSTADGLDVAVIAGLFGGGGHPRAAGFSSRIPEEWLRLTPNPDEQLP